MYGMETFSQLATAGTGIINASSISFIDWPTYHHRSFMADTGRRFWPVPTIKTVLAIAVKLNVLHLHLSDNCRYAVQSEAFPLLTERLTGILAGTYSKAGVAELVGYAADRGIRVTVHRLLHSRGSIPLCSRPLPPFRRRPLPPVFIGYSFPRAAVGAGSFSNYLPEFKARVATGHSRQHTRRCTAG